jgi:hypothetical protein
MSEDVAYTRTEIIDCHEIIELKTLGKFLYKVKGKWENEVTKTVKDLLEVRKEEQKLITVDMYKLRRC